MSRVTENEGIDIVVPWVDGSDPAWLAERDKIAGPQEQKAYLYRDWGLMRYWFRGVERNAPWVRKIHFITWGHLPPWLDTEHPKLHIVRHEDYMPERFRPTFSSNPLELNIHRIDGLAEHFIHTNDDVYFLAPLTPEEYFRNGLPCDCLSVEPMTEKCTGAFGHSLWNVMCVINRHFVPAVCAARNPEGWYSAQYTETVRQNNLEGCRWENFSGFGFNHSANAYLKSTIEEVWQEERYLLEASCLNRFRSLTDVMIWLMRYWQLAKGRFTPFMQQGRRALECGAPQSMLRDVILSPETRVLCVNEGGDDFDFPVRAAYIRALFERRLPEMCSFEKF